MHKDADKLAEEVISMLDKHGYSAPAAFLSSNCKVLAVLEQGFCEVSFVYVCRMRRILETLEEG